ncbi:ParB/RepB/Spo0J family partition protein [Streptomyces sp. NPDC094468]|uniref:ParB/RepB/Spo0J family partition protein n=1 Tax=Streptomyces sp. NPDC094468 TaxID=3366066 RepID=UPI00380D9328
MSKADQLGTGRSFGQMGGRGRSARGRAKAVTQGDLPSYELVRLHLEDVSPTPLNPRRNFGTDEELTRFGEELRQAQLAACVAVTRDAYLTLWPDHTELIGPVTHVLINGERRYRSARHVGLESLDFVVRDDLASAREQFINHLLKENLEREDFDVIERARGVQQLVDVCAEESERGARSRAAEQLGKDRSWVTNQLALLQLPEELQAMLSAGSLAERDGRLLARRLKDAPELGAVALLEHLEQSKAQAAAVKEQERAALDAARKASASDAGALLLSADNGSTGSDEAEAETEQPDASLSADNKQPQQVLEVPAEKVSSDSLSADNKLSGRTSRELSVGRSAVPSEAPSSEASTSLPAPRDVADDAAKEYGEGSGSQPRLLPYDDPFYIVQHLQVKMAPDDFVECGRFWLRALGEHHPDHFNKLLRELAEQQPS